MKKIQFWKLKHILYMSRLWLKKLGDWFMEDIVFTLLPIFVIMFIKLLTNQNLDSLYLSPEWSFATIVSFGVALSNIIKLKADLQKDLTFTLYSTTRLIVIFLILSVIVLALVVLRSDDLISLQESSLFVLQMSIFGVSILVLLLAYIGKEVTLETRNHLLSNRGIDKIKYYDYLRSSLATALDELEYVGYALNVKDQLEFSSWENNSYNLYPNMDEVDALVNKVDLTVDGIRRQIDKFSSKEKN